LERKNILMMKYFLTAKHWQIFFLVAGIPIIGDLFYDQTNSYVFSFHSVLTIISGVSFFTWLWSIESVIGKFRIAVNPIRSRQFKIIFFAVIFYIAISLLLLLLTGAFLDNVYWFVLHFICVIFVLIIFYQCAKLIKQVELNREPDFAEFFLYFLLIWFFPLGIWVMQPKLNRIMSPKLLLVK